MLVNPYDTNELLVLELDPSGARPVARTNTGLFKGQAAFTVSARYFYRVAGGVILRGEVRYGQLVERPVTTVAEGQAWLVAATLGGQEEALAGFSRVFRHSEWFRVDRQGRTTLAVPLLDPGETQLEAVLKLDSSGTLVLRRTRQAGSDFVRLDACDITGKLQYSQRRPVAESGEQPDLAGALWSGKVILWPGGSGIIKEQPEHGRCQELTASMPYVNAHTRLAFYRPQTLLAATGASLWSLRLAG